VGGGGVGVVGVVVLQATPAAGQQVPAAGKAALW
jgi:hypothetical protein